MSSVSTRGGKRVIFDFWEMVKSSPKDVSDLGSQFVCQRLKRASCTLDSEMEKLDKVDQESPCASQEASTVYIAEWRCLPPRRETVPYPWDPFGLCLERALSATKKPQYPPSGGVAQVEATCEYGNLLRSRSYIQNGGHLRKHPKYMSTMRTED